MIIEVKQPCFEYLLSEPSKVRYEHEEKDVCVIEETNPKWRTVIVQTHVKGLPIPTDNQILYKYSENRGYLLSK